jgi:S1-C subfamily serine protease
MQDDPPRPPGSASPPPAQPAPRRAGILRSAAAATTGSQHASRTAAAAVRPDGRRLSIHPLWLALGTVALFSVIFGIGAIASGGTSTASAPSGTDIEATTIHVINTVDPSVVQVQARGSRGSGVGSGEILTRSGYIVTNDHVVRGLTSFTALLADGRRVPARLVGEAPTEDLAVLKISALNLRPIAVGDSSTVQVGEYALAIGSPLGLEQSATFGIISALSRQANADVDDHIITLTGMIQTSAPINPGNSGGALVNLKGQLIGIPTLGAVETSSGVAANGIGFAISSNRMKAIVKQLTGGAA